MHSPLLPPHCSKLASSLMQPVRQVGAEGCGLAQPAILAQYLDIAGPSSWAGC
jgi:hypothetical protein